MRTADAPSSSFSRENSSRVARSSWNAGVTATLFVGAGAGSRVGTEGEPDTAGCVVGFGVVGVGVDGSAAAVEGGSGRGSGPSVHPPRNIQPTNKLKSKPLGNGRLRDELLRDKLLRDKLHARAVAGILMPGRLGTRSPGAIFPAYPSGLLFRLACPAWLYAHGLARHLGEFRREGHFPLTVFDVALPPLQ